MAIDYSGLFTSPDQIRAERLLRLQQQNTAVKGLGGSTEGLLGQIAAGSGGMLAEGIAGIFGLKTKAERDAEDKQIAVNSVKAQPGTPEYFYELSDRLAEIDPAASLAFKDKAIALEQQGTENEFKRQQLNMQAEGLDIQREGLKIQGITARIAQGKFDDETRRRKAYEGLAYGLTSDPAGLKAIGFEDNFIQSLADGDASMAVPIIADRLEDFADYSKTVAASGADTATIKDYKYYSSLDAEGKATFLAMKRDNTEVRDLGDKLAIIDKLSNQVLSTIDKGLAPEDKPEIKAAQTEAVEGTKNWLEDQAQRKKVIADSETGLEVIRKMDSLFDDMGTFTELALFGATAIPENDPETGKQHIGFRAPGLDQAREFQSYLDQVRGQAFLEAFETLKGGGQITQIEGVKATQAITRLQNRINLNDKEGARQAVRELYTVMSKAVDRARQGIVVENPYGGKSAGGSELYYDPSTGEIK